MRARTLTSYSPSERSSILAQHLEELVSEASPGALLVALLALLAPILAVILVVGAGVIAFRRALARRRQASPPPVR